MFCIEVGYILVIFFIGGKNHFLLGTRDGRAAWTHAKKIEPPLESSKKSFTPLTFEKKFDSPFFRLPPDHLNFDLSLTLTCMFFYFRLRQV